MKNKSVLNIPLNLDNPTHQHIHAFLVTEKKQHGINYITSVVDMLIFALNHGYYSGFYLNDIQGNVSGIEAEPSYQPSPVVEEQSRLQLRKKKPAADLLQKKEDSHKEGNTLNANSINAELFDSPLFADNNEEE